jgi:hypothetical protein
VTIGILWFIADWCQSNRRRACSKLISRYPSLLPVLYVWKLRSLPIPFWSPHTLTVREYQISTWKEKIVCLFPPFLILMSEKRFFPFNIPCIYGYIHKTRPNFHQYQPHEQLSQRDTTPMSTTKQWVLAGRRVWVDETRVFLRRGFIYEFFVVLTPFFHVSYRRHRVMCNIWIGQQRSTCSATLPSKDSGQSNTTGTINSVYFQSLSDLYKTSTILNIKYLLGKKKRKNLSLFPLSYNLTSANKYYSIH